LIFDEMGVLEPMGLGIGSWGLGVGELEDEGLVVGGCDVGFVGVLGLSGLTLG